MLEFWQEFWLFLRERKAYWLLPVVVILVLLGFLIILVNSPVVPFIYTLF